jgi:alkylation response protein AidB-like acyl-CoA dehydrogenase
MLKFVQDPQFGNIVDFEALRPVIKQVTDQLLPDFNMLGAIKYGSDLLEEHPGQLIAAGASMLSWMMLLAADELEMAEELKGKLFTLGWTEEHVGSDLLSLRTKATPISDNPEERNFHIKGGKWLINNSYHADYHLVLAKIDPEQDGPRSLSLFLVPHSSTSNWERLETHVLRDMVLTKFDIDGPGVLVGKRGYGLTIVQRMAMPSKYQASFVGMRMTQNSIKATIDHLSTKTIFKDQPINFSNVFRQMYNIVLQSAFLNFLFHRAVVFSDTSFLQFHGTMLKSFLLLRANELLSQNWLVAGSKGFLKESIIGRDAIDSFVLPVFDGHYTINTLMTAKHMDRYLTATRKANMQERIDLMREKLWLTEVGNQINKKPGEIRNPDFFDFVDYWDQLEVPLGIDPAHLIVSVRGLMAELEDTGLASESEYKYKTGALLHWLESVLAAAEFWKVIDNDDYLNVIVQQYNSFVKAFNEIVSEGNLQTPFMLPERQRPLPQVEDNETYLRKLFDIETAIKSMRHTVSGD